MLKELVQERPPEFRELESYLLRSLVCIDHGYNPTNSGYTAAGFISAGHVITASHNLHNGLATVINPSSLMKVDCRFSEYEPDTAISYKQYGIELNDLMTGIPKPGDLNLCFWLRHIGGGEFTPCVMWGVNIGHVQQNGKFFWGFQRNGARPKVGDSGALILTLGKNGDGPKVVGILRGVLGDDEICVFSPRIPQM